VISAIEWNGHTGRVGGAVAGALDPAVVGGEAANDELAIEAEETEQRFMEVDDAA
jgi:hypothetical protein